MIFSFTFFTYNGQRIFRIKKELKHPDKIGNRLKWVIKHNRLLTFFSITFGLIGLVCVYYVNLYCWIILVPMGTLSALYVIPVIPFKPNSPTLRQVPFLKIFVIALVWSIIIIGIPMLDTEHVNFKENVAIYLFILALLQVFFFVIGITIPFDIRDINYDREDNLKTIPTVFGIKKSLLIAILFL